MRGTVWRATLGPRVSDAGLDPSRVENLNLSLGSGCIFRHPSFDFPILHSLTKAGLAPGSQLGRQTTFTAKFVFLRSKESLKGGFSVAPDLCQYSVSDRGTLKRSSAFKRAASIIN